MRSQWRGTFSLQFFFNFFFVSLFLFLYFGFVCKVFEPFKTVSTQWNLVNRKYINLATFPGCKNWPMFRLCYGCSEKNTRNLFGTQMQTQTSVNKGFPVFNQCLDWFWITYTNFSCIYFGSISIFTIHPVVSSLHCEACN